MQQFTYENQHCDLITGYYFPFQSLVLCHTWIASQQNENFKYPHEFIPERWLTEQCPSHHISQHHSSTQTSQPEHPHSSPHTSQPLHHNDLPQTSPPTRECFCDVQGCHTKSFLVAPFGVGKRMCPGKRFVNLELQVVLAQVSWG